MKLIQIFLLAATTSFVVKAVSCISTIQPPVCKNFTLPLHFTYYQRDSGLYCRDSTRYLEDVYGIPFSEVAENIQTTDPNVRFTIKEVTYWNELAARIHQLDDTFYEVKEYGPHTPSLFLDGCTDKYWHANADEDTISGIFKPTIDAYISGCLNSNKIRPEDGNEVWTPQDEVAKDEIRISSTDTSCALDLSNSSGFSISANADMLNHDSTGGPPCFVFFYSTGCPHCAVARSYIDNDLEDEIEMPFRYEAYEVHSGHARELLLGYELFEYTSEKAVPTVFVGSNEEMTIIVGDNDIIQRLPIVLLHAQNETLDCFDFRKLDQSDELVASVSNINWGMVTAAAFVDSINPCAIAVLVILLSGLVASVVPQQHEDEHQQQPEEEEEATAPSTNPEKSIHRSSNKERYDLMDESGSVPSNQASTLEIEVEAASELRQKEIRGHDEDTEVEDPKADRHENNAPAESENHRRNSQTRRAFISGMAFILSIFISYYLLGFGIFSAVSATGVSDIILLVFGICIVILGLWNVKDFFFYNQGFNVEIPRAWRPLLKRILGAITSPTGAFVAGFLVSLFELPCSGGPYLFILGLLADKNTRAEAAFLLLYYNFIFVLPLILINCLVYFGVTRIQNVGNWKDKYIRHLHLAVGLVLIALGTLAITDYFKPLF